LEWPATSEQLKAAGFADAQSSKWCSCGVMIHWYKTPGGKWIPLSMTSDLKLEPHHATCKNVRDFQQADREHAERSEERVRGKKPTQGELF
jgi:hypothetical protein